MGVKGADRRITDELRVEVEVKKHFKKKLARSSLTWAGRAERMGDEKLTKRADAQKVEENQGKEDRNCLKET